MSDHHITALVTLSTDVPQPKNGGVRSGYAPHHKFDGVEYLVSGFHSYVDSEIHYPGETVMAEITFPSWAFFGGQIKPGDIFEIREMSRLVGSGIVQSVDA
ncbi:hypothetical protein [Chitinimonas lacunae]|uniref:Elongation factor Tu n=1 Tax=Chitinimonas lacunae TaxID=1963018 RepID=A0ABV8MQS4_9NEIS